VAPAGLHKGSILVTRNVAGSLFEPAAGLFCFLPSVGCLFARLSCFVDQLGLVGVRQVGSFSRFRRRLFGLPAWWGRRWRFGGSLSLQVVDRDRKLLERSRQSAPPAANEDRELRLGVCGRQIV